MRKPPWSSLSFLWYAFLLTLAIGSGGWTVVRDLYFYSRGQSAPNGTLPTFLYVCSIAAVWVLWLHERRRTPDLSGEAFDFSGYGIHGVGQEYGHWQATTEMTFRLYLCNTRSVPTIVRSLVLDGRRLRPPLGFHWPSLRSRYKETDEELIGTELHHGIGKDFKIRVDTAADGFKNIGDVPTVPMDKLIIRVQDSFGRWHKMKIRAGEQIRFGER